jgi:hypothetical protein
MAKQAKGIKSITNLAFETTYGTIPTTGTFYRMPINKNALTSKQNLIESNTITGRRDAVEPGIGQLDASGQLECPLDVRNVGNVLKALFGAPTTTPVSGKTGVYQHVFKVLDEVPSLTVEKGFPDIALFYRYAGVKASKFSLTAQVGNNETTYTLDTMAANETESTTALSESPTSLPLEKFNNVNAAVKEGGTTLGICRSMQVDIDNGLDGDTYCLNGSGIRPSINEGTLAVSGSIEVLFEDNALLTKAMNGTETSLELVYTKGDNSLSFLIPEVILERATPTIDGSKGIKAKLSYKGFYANDTNNSTAVVTLINDVAEY